MIPYLIYEKPIINLIGLTEKQKGSSSPAATMFKAVHGVSTVEFLKQGMSQEAFGQTLAQASICVRKWV